MFRKNKIVQEAVEILSGIDCTNCKFRCMGPDKELCSNRERLMKFPKKNVFWYESHYCNSTPKATEHTSAPKQGTTGTTGGFTFTTTCYSQHNPRQAVEKDERNKCKYFKSYAEVIQ